MRAILLEDDPALTTLFRPALTAQGIEVDVVHTEDALLQEDTGARVYDFAILDGTRPGSQSMDRCARIVAHMPIPMQIIHPYQEVVHGLAGLAHRPVIWLSPALDLEELHCKSQLMRILAAGTSVPAPHPPLTERERDVLRHIREHRSDAWIAAELSRSPSTVKEYVRRLKVKLGVTRREEQSRISA